MARPDLQLPQAFVAWMAPFLAAFCQRSRDTAAALAVVPVFWTGSGENKPRPVAG